MGTGKTSVGHLVASLLHFKMVDTDELIEQLAAKRISTIFQQDGEAAFRQMERQVVAELSHLRDLVISTGGGLVIDPVNLNSLKRHSLVVCLWASPDTIWERVRHQAHRPLLNAPDPLERIRQLLTEREPFYRQCDVLVNSEGRSVKEVALHVVHQFRLER